VDRMLDPSAQAGPLLSLAQELQALESETFEIRDYTDANEMMLTAAPVAAAGSTSTSSCSTSSSTTSSCSTSSTCSS
jgi:thiazolylpeptide-type bacteriocin precursor